MLASVTAIRTELADDDQLPEVLDFAARCFRTLDPGHDDFLSLYPDLYLPQQCNTRTTYVIHVDGRIAATAGVFSTEFTIAGAIVPVATIGQVCVDPELRGRGLMRELMHGILSDIKRLGYAVSVLRGDAVLYQPFGYERVHHELWCLLDTWAPGVAVNRSAERQACARVSTRDASIWRLLCDHVRAGGSHQGVEPELLRLKYQRRGIAVYASTEKPGAHIAVDERKHPVEIVAWAGPAHVVGAVLASYLVNEVGEGAGGVQCYLPLAHSCYHDIMRSMTVDSMLRSEQRIALVGAKALFKSYSGYLERRRRELNAVGEIRLLIHGSRKLREERITMSATNSGIHVCEGFRGPPTLALSRRELTLLAFSPAARISYDIPEHGWLAPMLPLPFHLASLAIC